MPSFCRSCKAEIRWAKTDLGRPIPIDAEPAEDGTLVLRETGGELKALNAASFGEEDEPRFKTHFATCPFADEHRKPGVRPTGPSTGSQGSEDG